MPGHVHDRIQQLLDGALAPDEAVVVRDHLRTCARCRSFHADVTHGRALMGLLPPAGAAGSGAADAAWQGILAEIGRRPGGSRRPRLRLAWAALAAAALVVTVAVPVARLAGQPRWVVEPISGEPLADGLPLRDARALRGAPVVTTDETSRALLRLPGLGTIDVAPGSRVRVVSADGARVAGLPERRLALDHGQLHARVLAPPRLLIVETPAATAIDLGCEYELAVDRDGAGLLRVISGRVALVSGGSEVVVGAGEEARFGHESTPALRRSSPH